jgi:hypothetical protein
MFENYLYFRLNVVELKYLSYLGLRNAKIDIHANLKNRNKLLDIRKAGSLNLERSDKQGKGHIRIVFEYGRGRMKEIAKKPIDDEVDGKFAVLNAILERDFQEVFMYVTVFCLISFG